MKLILTQDGSGLGAPGDVVEVETLDAFIGGRIRFTDMAGVVEDTLAELSGAGGLGNPAESLDNVFDMDREARRIAAARAGDRDRT